MIAADVAAVVLVFNGRATLEAVLDRIDAQECRPARVIVVDNVSTDGTAELLAARPDLEVITLEDNEGVGAGHTAGWRAAMKDRDCRYIWALEHDSLAEPACLAHLLSTARELVADGRAVGAVKSWIERDEDEAGIARWKPAGTEPRQQPRVTFNAVLFRREAIEAIGFPCADFFVGQEDYDYSRRLHAGAFEIWWEPAALCLHATKGSHRHGERSSVFRSYYASRNALYMRVHGGDERWARVRSVGWAAGSIPRIVWRDDAKVRRVCARTVAVFDALSGRLGRREYWFLR